MVEMNPVHNGARISESTDLEASTMSYSVIQLPFTWELADLMSYAAPMLLWYSLNISKQ